MRPRRNPPRAPKFCAHRIITKAAYYAAFFVQLPPQDKQSNALNTLAKSGDFFRLSARLIKLWT